MTTQKKANDTRDEATERLEAAMKRYAELAEKVSRFAPRRRFTVIPTVDKWERDVSSLLPGSTLPASQRR